MSDVTKELYCVGCWKHLPVHRFDEKGSKVRRRCISCRERMEAMKLKQRGPKK